MSSPTFDGLEVFPVYSSGAGSSTTLISREKAVCNNFEAIDDDIEEEFERETESYRYEYCMERTEKGTMIIFYQSKVRAYYARFNTH